MWELIYEDTFGFGDERDPPSSEKTGDVDREGVHQLWLAVLNESITGAPGKPARGFARFTLVIKSTGGAKKSVAIDVDKYLKPLAVLKFKTDAQLVQETAARHYEAYLQNKEAIFWAALNRQFTV